MSMMAATSVERQTKKKGGQQQRTAVYCERQRTEADVSRDVGGGDVGRGGVAVVLSRPNKLIVSGCYESYFFYPFLPAATYLFLPVSTCGSRQNETLTNKMRVDLPAGRKNDSHTKHTKHEGMYHHQS